jgi:hypothetical protein
MWYWAQQSQSQWWQVQIQQTREALFAFFTFFFSGLGFELRAYTLSHSTNPIFVKGFCEIRSHELFACASFKP